MSKSRLISCPTCGKRGDWLVTSHGPFCSPRCKLVDLGKWLGGEHVISEPLSASTGSDHFTPDNRAPSEPVA